MNALVVLLAALPLWRPIGPEGGLFHKVVAEARVPGRMFAAAGYRSWMSDDGGATWRHLTLAVRPTVLRDAATDPSNRNVVWAATIEGLMRSRDGGATFATVVPDFFESVVFDGATMYAGSVGTVYATTNGGASWASSRIDNSTLTLCAGNGVVYAAGSQLSRSIDGGRTWRAVSDRAGYIACDGDRVWNYDGELQRSDDRGDHWATVSTTLGGGGLVADPANHRLYLTALNALRVSDDGGATWRDAGGLPAAGSSAFAAAGSRLLVSVAGHLMTSDDGGGAWRISEAGVIGGFVDSIAADPIVPGLVLATVGGRVMRRDHGAWTTSFNYPGLTATGLAFDPAIPARAVALVWEQSSGAEILFQSRDTGATWAKSAAIAGAGSWSTPWKARVIFDSRSPSAVFVAERDWPFETVHASGDFGASWRELGPIDGVVNDFVPASPATMYAGTDYGLFRSTDNGATWTPAAPVKVDDECRASVDSQQRVRALAVDGATVIMANWNCLGARIYKSSDGGRTWGAPARLPAMRYGRPWYVSDVAAIVVDPKHSQRLFAATDLGVFESDDGGDSWRALNDGFDDDIGSISALVIDPEADRLYAGTWFAGVWQLDLSDAPPRRRAAR